MSSVALQCEDGVCVLLIFDLKNIFSDVCQANYLNIHRSDLHGICRIGRTMAVDERSEVISFDLFVYVYISFPFGLFAFL